MVYFKGHNKKKNEVKPLKRIEITTTNTRKNPTTQTIKPCLSIPSYSIKNHPEGSIIREVCTLILVKKLQILFL